MPSHLILNSVMHSSHLKFRLMQIIFYFDDYHLGLFVKFQSDFVAQLLMSDSLGVAQARAFNDWLITGDFALGSLLVEDTSYPNGCDQLLCSMQSGINGSGKSGKNPDPKFRYL